MDDSGACSKQNKHLQSTDNRDYEYNELSKEEGDSPLTSIFNEAQSLMMIEQKHKSQK